MTFFEVLNYYLLSIAEQIGWLSLVTISFLLGFVIGVIVGRVFKLKRRKKERNPWDDVVRGNM